MRYWGLPLVVVCLAANASAQELRRLTPAETSKGFSGLVACRSPHANDECNSVIIELASEGNHRTVQEIGLLSIADMISTPMAQEIRALPVYARYADLFSELERRRAAGNYAHIKSVETASGTYRTEAGAWCRREPSAGLFDSVAFYFSNTNVATIDADEAFEPGLQERLRAFLTELVLDEEFQRLGPQDVEARASMDAMLGRREMCIGYVGAIHNGSIQVRGMLADTEGLNISYLSDPLRMLPAGSDIRLAVN